MIYTPEEALQHRIYEVEELRRDMERMKLTLTRIAKWWGEFPEGIAEHPNAEREYIRFIAHQALDGDDN